MDERIIEKNDEVEIDLRRIFSAIWSKAWFVAASAAVGAVLAVLITLFFITPEYESTAMFYVNNNSLSVGDASFSLTSGDLSTSRNLVESYIVILKTRETLTDVADYAGVNIAYEDLKDMISAAAVNQTEIFQVVVTDKDPVQAERIADAIAYILPKRIASIIEGTSAEVVDAAVIPSEPSSPSYLLNTLLGFALGMMICVAVIALREIFDITIRSEEDVEQCCKHPILAAVPDMAAPSKGSSYYYYYGKGKDKNKKSNKGKGGLLAAGKQPAAAPVLMGSQISFAASEAYKLLRTKLQFSFSDENNSRVIALSSALSGEGKSLTAVNLAYTLSQLDKKVILLDCDMRRPTLAKKLGISRQPGLSSFLTGQSQLNPLIQPCGLKNEENAFHVIAAGQNPPNPIELLSSARMQTVLQTLREAYDYVIMDLPPVGEVSDAMAVAKETDGMLLVVRQDYCDRVVLSEAVRQFDFIDSKILGVIFNCTNDHAGKYGKYGKYHYRKYGRYGRRYYRSYYDKTAT